MKETKEFSNFAHKFRGVLNFFALNFDFALFALFDFTGKRESKFALNFLKLKLFTL